MTKITFTTPDGASYPFASVEDVRRFVELEMNAWQWLNAYRNTNPGQMLIDSIFTPLGNANSYFAQQSVSDEMFEMGRVQLQQYFDSLPLVHPRSTLRGLIGKLALTTPDEALFMIFTVGQQQGKWGHYADRAIAHTGYLAGIAKGLAFSNGWNSTESATIASQSAESSSRAAGEALSASITSRDEANQILASFKEWEIGHRERLSGLNDSIRESHENLTTELKNSASETKQSLQQDWKNLTSTYDVQLALRAPATYWGIKSKRHTQWVWILGISCAIWLAIGALALPKLASSVFGLTTVGTIPTWFQVISFSLGALIFVLVLRSILRLMMSHVHLALDATERRTMIVSYLSLVRRGSLKDEALEKVLSSIFRPTGDGIIKDEGIPLSVLSELFKKS